jgi:hypothetical protein
MKLQYREFFSDTISNLGYKIYELNNITQMEADDNLVKAHVFDQDLYNVEIKSNNGRIVDMKCDCTYSDFGYYCMHMAAVCFYLENANLKINEDQRNTIVKKGEQSCNDVTQTYNVLRKEAKKVSKTKKEHPSTKYSQTVLELDLKLFPSMLEDDKFFDDLIMYANLLEGDGEKNENIISLMEKYKRNYKVFEWLIGISHRQKNQLHELQMIEEGITWCQENGDMDHLDDLYRVRKDFYSSL